MPIYEYTCAGCGRDMEIWQKMSEKSKKVCPECGAHKLERLISHTSFHLKGSGWYVTDYAKGKSPGTTSGATKSESPPAPKTETAKPAADK